MPDLIFDGGRFELESYLRELADLMGLRDWKINVLSSAPEEDDYAAKIDVRYGRKFANVTFDPEWASEKPESLRATCVHELLHCHLKPTEWAINNAGRPLGETAFNILHGSYIDALEMATDAIAVAWSETLPLPIRKTEDTDERD